MTDEQRYGSADPEVKVTDRRRFMPDGEANPAATEPASGGAAAGAVLPAPDERDAQLARQEARIDELTRAYAALIEEGKAARQRLEREKARVLEAERIQLAQALLDSADELERALAAAAGATGPLVDGVRLCLATLQKRVSELGAVRLTVVGERFDPRLAEAVDLVPVSQADQDELVVQEVRAGYRIGERVLRPARVRVGRFAAA